MNNTNAINLTKDNPSLDLVSPVITMNSGVTPLYSNVYVYLDDFPIYVKKGFIVYK